MIQYGDEGQNNGLQMLDERMPGTPARRQRTTAAHEPEMTQPILCASQFTPSELQKLLWSTAWVLSDGQDAELAMDGTAQGRPEC